MDITIKNYRCFPDTSPARISLRKGFTAVLGSNNSGKSSLLKFFYEFRNLFSMLATPNSGNFLDLLRGSTEGFNIQGIQDLPEVFSNLNTRDMTLQFDFRVRSRRPVASGHNAQEPHPDSSP